MRLAVVCGVLVKKLVTKLTMSSLGWLVDLRLVTDRRLGRPGRLPQWARLGRRRRWRLLIQGPSWLKRAQCMPEWKSLVTTVNPLR